MPRKLSEEGAHTVKTCSISGCDRPLRYRNWCAKHYQRWRKNGDPAVCLTENGRSLAERFERSIDPSGGPDSCHPKTKSGGSGGGYGRMLVGGKRRQLHHVAWFLAEGYWPTYLRHKCDNPPCANRRHLLEGDHQDNMRDMVERGRQVTRCGEQHHAAKLTVSQVAEIRDLRANGTRLVALAAEYGVNHTTISRIARGVVWRAD